MALRSRVTSPGSVSIGVFLLSASAAPELLIVYPGSARRLKESSGRALNLSLNPDSALLVHRDTVSNYPETFQPVQLAPPERRRRGCNFSVCINERSPKSRRRSDRGSITS